MNSPKSRYTVLFWQKLFIYCWVFSLAGYVFELLWAQAYHFIIGGLLWHPLIVTAIPLAPPYGLGVVAIILFVLPLTKRYKLTWPAVFLLTLIAASVVEYASALVAAALHGGHNGFWDYSNLPLNLNGYISVGSSLVFGVLATLFVYYVYPACERLFANLSRRAVTVLFWILFVAYGADLAVYFLKP